MNDRKDPYRNAGLRQNPFRPNEEETLPGSVWMDLGLPDPPEPTTSHLYQVKGPRGTGKTSHLRRWQNQLGGPYHHYPIHYVSRWTHPPTGTTVFWDEANRIPFPLLVSGFLMMRWKGGTIYAGTHRDLSGIARGLGFSVTPFQLDYWTPREVRTWAKKQIRQATLEHENPPHELLPSEEKLRDLMRKADRSLPRIADELHAWIAREVKEKTDNK